MSVHSFQFLCKSRTCGKEFTWQVALDKHELTHQGPCFFSTVCRNGFLFKYQLNSHANMHTDFVNKCCYPRCGKVYKSKAEYRKYKKSIRQPIRSIHAPHVAKTFWEKKIGMNIWLFTQMNSRMNVQNVVRNTGGIPACQNT